MGQETRLGMKKVVDWCKEARVDIEFVGETTYPSKRSDIPDVVRDTYRIGSNGLCLIVNPNKEYKLVSNGFTVVSTYSQSAFLKELLRLHSCGKLA